MRNKRVKQMIASVTGGEWVNPDNKTPFLIFTKWQDQIIYESKLSLTAEQMEK